MFLQVTHIKILLKVMKNAFILIFTRRNMANQRLYCTCLPLSQYSDSNDMYYVIFRNSIPEISFKNEIQDDRQSEIFKVICYRRPL